MIWRPGRILKSKRVSLISNSATKTYNLVGTGGTPFPSRGTLVNCAFYPRSKLVDLARQTRVSSSSIPRFNNAMTFLPAEESTKIDDETCSRMPILWMIRDEIILHAFHNRVDNEFAWRNSLDTERITLQMLFNRVFLSHHLSFELRNSKCWGTKLWQLLKREIRRI